jgi:hypothetical protein
MSLQGKPGPNRASDLSSTGDELPTCWQRDRQPACLRLELASGEIYVMPYPHFIAAHLCRAGDGERLKISFSTHEIAIDGDHLRELVIALSDVSVAVISEMPARYQKSIGSRIASICVALAE